MSNTQYIFMQSADVPTREVLQQAIDTIGFDLQLDSEFDPLASEGFSPCILQGVGGIGFELYRESVDELRQDECFRDMTKGRDFCLTMTWGGSMRDCAAVLIVSAAFANVCGATASYEGEAPEPFDTLVDEAHAALRDD